VEAEQHFALLMVKAGPRSRNAECCRHRSRHTILAECRRPDDPPVNKQIGDALFLSDRRVGNHVSRTVRKFGVISRTQVAHEPTGLEGNVRRIP